MYVETTFIHFLMFLSLHLVKFITEEYFSLVHNVYVPWLIFVVGETFKQRFSSLAGFANYFICRDLK